jgi:hypothetical protein
MQRHLLSLTSTKPSFPSLYCSTQRQGRRGAGRRCPAPAPAWRTSAPRRSSSVTEPAAPATTTPTSSPSGSPRSTPGTCLPSPSHRRSRSESAPQRDTIPKIRNKYSQKRSCAAIQSQFLHSCFCERFIFSTDRFADSAAGK